MALYTPNRASYMYIHVRLRALYIIVHVPRLQHVLYLPPQRQHRDKCSYPRPHSLHACIRVRRRYGTGDPGVGCVRGIRFKRHGLRCVHPSCTSLPTVTSSRWRWWWWWCHWCIFPSTHVIMHTHASTRADLHGHAMQCRLHGVFAGGGVIHGVLDAVWPAIRTSYTLVFIPVLRREGTGCR